MNMEVPDMNHWGAPTSSIDYSAFIAASKSYHAIETETWRTLVTAGLDEKPAYIGDGNVPVWNTAPPTANAAVGVVAGGAPFVGGGGNGGAAGEGMSLGVITVMVMVYNVCAGLGLGLMLWKGIIDWKGNIKPATNVDNNDVETDNDTNDNNNENAINFDYNDRNTGSDLGRPFNVVDSAETNSNLPPGVVELEGSNGRTTRARLSAVMDAAVHELRMRATGLY